MALNGIQVSRLQIAIRAWIKKDGGPFGACLARREVKTPEGLLTVDEVALRMAEAGGAVFELAAAASGRSCRSCEPGGATDD